MPKLSISDSLTEAGALAQTEKGVVMHFTISGKSGVFATTSKVNLAIRYHRAGFTVQLLKGTK